MSSSTGACSAPRTPSAASSSNDALMLSVSGCRGIVGTSLTPAVVARYVSAFGSWLWKQGIDENPCVVLARDGRCGGEAIAQLAGATLQMAGFRVVHLGVATTPTAGLLTLAHGAAGGLVITASHNPEQWNGIKSITAQGGAPSLSQATELLAMYAQQETHLVAADRLGERDADDTAAHVHVATTLEAIERVFPVERIKRARFRVALDSCNASGALAGRMLLDALGCDVVHIHNDGSGVFPRVAEPVVTSLGDLCAAVKEHNCEIGFAQDPDADRLAIVDETGRCIGEEHTLVLAAESLLGSANPVAGDLAANLSTSRMIDDVVAKYGRRVVRTPVGEANVVTGMREHGCTLGGEGNGGVIWTDIVPIRDSLGAMALTLALMARRDATIGTLVDETPKYSIVKDKMPVSDGVAERISAAMASCFPDATRDEQDGVRLDFEEDSAWVHVRPSNTEPIVRCIAEAPTQEKAQQLIDAARKALA